MDKEFQQQVYAQAQLQRESNEQQQTPYAPQMFEAQQEHQAVLVEQTNPKRIVKSIILRLMGREEQQDGTYEQVAEPKLNKVGVDNVWFILDSHINQNTILSNLKEGTISKIMDILQSDIVDDLAMNWRAYGISKKSDLDTINNSILTNIFLCLKRAEGQNEKNWLSKISVEQISGSRIQPQKKENWLGRFKL